MTVYNGTVDARNRLFSSETLSWEAQSTGGGGGASSTQVAVSSVAGVVTLATTSTGVTVTPAAGSTFNVRALNSSAADLAMTATPAAGSTWNVRALNSTAADLLMTASPSAGSTWNCRVLNSTAADLLMTASPSAGSTWNCRVLNSSAADLLCNVSSVAGVITLATTSTGVTVTPAAGSTFNVRALNSTAADFLMTASPSAGSTWNCRVLNSSAADLLCNVSSVAGVVTLATTSTGVTATLVAASTTVTATLVAASTSVTATLVAASTSVTAKLWAGIEASTFAASTKTSTTTGLMVRQAVPDCTSAGGIIATAGDNAMISSAVTSIYCYALWLQGGIGNSTATPTAGSSAVVLRVQNGTTSANLWRVTYQASTLSGAAQGCEPIAVTPPAYLFKTGPGNLLNLNATSSGGGYSVACWRE